MSFWPLLLGGALQGVGSALEQRQANQRQAANMMLQLGGYEALTPELTRTLGYEMSPAMISNLRKRIAGQERFRQWSALPQDIKTLSLRSPNIQDMLREQAGYETPRQTESIDMPGLKLGGGGIFNELSTEPATYEYQTPVYPMTTGERLNQQAQSALARMIMQEQLRGANRPPTQTELDIEAMGRGPLLENIRQRKENELIPKTPFQAVQRNPNIPPEKKMESVLVGTGQMPNANVLEQTQTTKQQGKLNREAAMGRVIVGGELAADRQNKLLAEQNRRLVTKSQAILERESRTLANANQNKQFNLLAGELIRQFNQDIAVGNPVSIGQLENKLIELRKRIGQPEPKTKTAPPRLSDQDLINALKELEAK